ncbi:MAG: hypothetical protein ACPIB0_01385 [Akkermansiaceae bacterium]
MKDIGQSEAGEEKHNDASWKDQGDSKTGAHNRDPVFQAIMVRYQNSGQHPE